MALAVALGLLLSACGRTATTATSGEETAPDRTGGSMTPTTSSNNATGAVDHPTTEVVAEILDVRSQRFFIRVPSQVSRLAQACEVAAATTSAREACRTPDALLAYETEDQRAFKKVLHSLKLKLGEMTKETDEFETWYQCVAQLQPPLVGLTRDNVDRLVNEALGAGTITVQQHARCVDAAYENVGAIGDQRNALIAQLVKLPEASELVRLAAAVGI